MFYMSVFYTLLVVIVMNGLNVIKSVPIHSNEHYSQVSDVCDWEGSGVDNGVDNGADGGENAYSDSQRVIIPVYVRCSHGTIKWYYPKGGLRVVLRHGTANKSFRGCIRVARNTSNVRMYIEGNQQLHKLYSTDDGKHIDLLRCFVSYNGKIAIFIKAENSVTPDVNSNFVKFSYDLQTVSSDSEFDSELEECRPCDDNEMLSLFCTSDFIIKGTIHSLYHNNDLERSELTVRAHEIIKEPIDSTYSMIANKSSIDQIYSQYGIIKYFTLYRPLKCQTKAGSGTEFIFFGRWLLGNPVISCAPKLTYWKHVKSKALESGANQCLL